MRHFKIALLAGAGALFAGSASAAPIANGVSGLQPRADVEQVRTVCDEDGRCYRTRGSRRVYIQEDSYAYAPRHRYREHRYYNDGPAVGVYGAPGVGVSVGVGRW